MRATGVAHELKLPLQTYLRGARGQRISQRVAAALGVTSDSVAALLTHVQPLEVYMPIREQRNAFHGEPLIVASQLREDEDPIGFDAHGAEVALSNSQRPTTPVLSLVPVETNFNQPAFRLSKASRTILPPDCDPAVDICGSDPGPTYGVVPANATPGLYMVSSDLYDTHEPWIRGDPEVEVHVVGPSATDTPDFARTLSCSGEHAAGAKYFDQNATSWSGVVLLMTKAEMQTQGLQTGLPDNRKFFVTMWEDDDEACVIHDDPNRLANQLQAVGVDLGIGIFTALKCDVITPVICGLEIWNTVYQVLAFGWGLFTNNDDYLGLIVPVTQFPAYTGPGTHAVLRDPSTSQNGGIRLVYKDQ